MKNRYDVFVSYNRAQMKWVRRLVAELRNCGIRPFFDEEVGLVGTALTHAIADALLSSRCCIIVLTPESVKSQWVGYEIQRALHMDPDSMRRFLIPLLLKDCKVPTELDNIGRVDCRRGLTKKNLAELIRAIGQRGEAKFVGPARPSDLWRWCYAPANVDLTDITFLNEFKGWIVGDRGPSFKPSTVAERGKYSTRA
jgi:hypothetical protein